MGLGKIPWCSSWDSACSLGHSDRIWKKLSAQLKKVQHISNLYRIEEQEILSKYLTTQSCAESVFFCNSGVEANESAIKLIKKYGNTAHAGKESFILAAESSFHGRTLATLSATGRLNTKGFWANDYFKFFKYNDIV